MKLNASNIMAEFKAKQNLVSKDFRPKKPTSIGFNNRDMKTSKQVNSPYGTYKKKLENGDFSKFSNRDILYFFIDVAKENGVDYLCANAQIDMRQFKLCKERGIENEELLAIIEFVYTSGQTYLSLDTFHPGILVSQWIRTLRKDTQLWLDDKFDPNAKSKAKLKVKDREWSEAVPTEDKAEVDEWGY